MKNTHKQKHAIKLTDTNIEKLTGKGTKTQNKHQQPNNIIFQTKNNNHKRNTHQQRMEVKQTTKTHTTEKKR